MKRYSIPIAVVLCVFFLVGCAQFQKVKSPAEMTPKEKATWMLSMYRKQYDDYLAVSARPDLTEAEKEVLRKKKKILVEVEPLIEGYAEFVRSGAIPDAATEKRILDLINELVYN